MCGCVDLCSVCAVCAVCVVCTVRAVRERVHLRACGCAFVIVSASITGGSTHCVTLR